MTWYRNGARRNGRCDVTDLKWRFVTLVQTYAQTYALSRIGELEQCFPVAAVAEAMDIDEDALVRELDRTKVERGAGLIDLCMELVEWSIDGADEDERPAWITSSEWENSGRPSESAEEKEKRV